MVLGHTLGAGGPSIELLIVAFVLMWLGVLFYFRKAVKPVVSVVLIVAALGLAGGSFILDRASSGAGIEVAIQEPSAGAEVRANRPMRLDVRLTGGRIVSSTTSEAPNGGHLHLYVDGEIVSMPTTARPSVELKPGTHTITVEFVDVQHRPFDPPISDQVRVTAV